MSPPALVMLEFPSTPSAYAERPLLCLASHECLIRCNDKNTVMVIMKVGRAACTCLT